MNWSKFFAQLINTLCGLGGLAGILVGAIGAVALKPWAGWVLAGGLVGLAICTAMTKAQE